MIRSPTPPWMIWHSCESIHGPLKSLPVNSWIVRLPARAEGARKDRAAAAAARPASRIEREGIGGAPGNGDGRRARRLDERRKPELNPDRFTRGLAIQGRTSCRRDP